MALDPKLTRNITFKTGRITSKVRGAKMFAMTRLAREMQVALRKVISVPGTKKLRSAPGQPPRMQTRFLRKNTDVVFRDSKLVVKLPNYGIWLEGGTRKMAPRPFVDPTIRKTRATWERRARALMRQFVKSK